MIEGPKLDGVALDALLRDRSQFQGWLARIDENASRVPESVTAKVRADYDARLRQVLDQLRAHAGAVGEALDTLRTALGALEGRDAVAAERLAEAELRHLVGEYDDDAWESLRGEVDGERRGFHADMEQTRQEISRLADVQSIILNVPDSAAPAVVAAVPPAPEPMAAPAAPPSLPEGVTLLEDVAPTPSPAPAMDAPAIFAKAPGTRALDELDFLKSVTDEAAEQPAASARQTATAPEKGKSVRCRECGHDNRVSDWYCDRCAAELTDL